MATRLGILMDPIQQITPYKDTSLAMLLAASRRDWQLHYLELADLFLRDGEAWGRNRELRVRDDNQDWFSLGAASEAPLAELDLLLIRKDPPFDGEYLYATQILSLAEDQGLLVVNRPAGLRDANEKLASAWFPQCCAPTIVDADAERLKRFIQDQGHAVLKPLDGMGGRSIFVLADGDPNTTVVIDTLTDGGRRYAMAQRYLPEIRDGDKRILVIDGEPVPYALARVPASGETRGNLAAGGRGLGQPLSDRDQWIVDQVAETLVTRGLRFVGLDVIGDYLTEVNVTSPTCVRELDAQFDLDIAGQLLDRLATDLNDR
ncbi:glutathione synthase [Methylonatrum kenyense]|uniref:glutathione synthase n=1 Tax=Methylonatrum kenyense TaxID=455253 RepID=UPI0020BDFE84|nr:glutathione synthase [Methylonatrum kenyense]MCK8516635.1 glutathione synthase [Methylonatrum kenyense]